MSLATPPVQPAPWLSLVREPVNGFLHLGGLVASVVATVAMLWATRANPALMASLAVYGLSMCGCFLGSSLHHLVHGDRRLNMRLLRLDQSLIFPFIAGTYTPVCLWLLPAPGSLWLLAVVWALALVGVAYRVGFAPDPQEVTDPPHWVDMGIYLLMGWQLVWQLMPLAAHSLPGTLPLVVLGGAAFTVGGVIFSGKHLDFWPGRLGHHEIWHLCVLAGSSFFFTYLWLNLVVPA